VSDARSRKSTRFFTSPGQRLVGTSLKPVNNFASLVA
jgi:hypothetical protein